MSDITEKKRLLAQSRLFASFGQDVIDAIAPLLSPCKFDADNVICLKGDDSDCLYVIRSGEVEVSVSSSDGKIILLGILSEGDVFGEVGLLDKESRTANVTARTDTLLYRLATADFEKITARFGLSEWRALTAYICFLFRGVTNNLEETVFLDAGVRVAKKIERLYRMGEGEKDDKAFTVTISQENLGRLAGLSREATNKALSQLEERGLIERQYKRIRIADIDDFITRINANI